MEKLNLRPCKALLAIWLAYVILVGVVLAVVLGWAFHLDGVNAFLGIVIAAFLDTAVVAYVLLYYDSVRYEVDDRYVSRASGVIWKLRRSIPLEKITNLDVRRGPVERILGFGRIWIFTPSTGAQTPEETLQGIPRPDEVKQAIVDRTEASKSAFRGTPATPEPAPAPSEGEMAHLLKEILATLQRIEGKMGVSGNAPADQGVH